VALYVAINTVYLRAMPMHDLARATEPARTAAWVLGGDAAAAVLSPLVALCVLSSMQASTLVGPRIYCAMAGDGLFFAPLGRLNGRTHVPVAALLAQSVVAVVQLVSGSFDQLLTFTTFAIVAFSMLTVGAVFVLRVRRSDAQRAFRVPGHPWVPLLFLLVNGWVLWCVAAGEGAHAALAGLAIVATGVPAYAVFRARRRALEPS
ncbi:MAG: amino acid permease, partial [Myxococcota bacterium]|nr:amino acid permease [Myxococcota bacterium]